MAEFTADFRSLRPTFSLSDVDPNMELLNQFTSTLNPHILDNSHLNMQGFMPFCSDSFSSHRQLDFSGNLMNNFPCPPHHGNQNAVSISHPIADPPADRYGLIDSRKRIKPLDMPQTSCSANSSPPISEAEIEMKNTGNLAMFLQSSGKAKKAKSNVLEEEKPKEVVHVRARRGQATDSHSLAERVRRGKINEKLKCLRNIVPGCYKTMGMAVMLDEIINYVQSLQNQVEFLSMKLTAASIFYDFNSETDDLETLQRAKANEAKELERLLKAAGYDGGSSFQTKWSP